MTETAQATQSYDGKPPADDTLGPDLLSVVARLQRWATRHAQLPISPALGRLLAQIDELGASRIGDLARADHCSQPTMSTQVQRLEDMRLADRSVDPADARAVLITLTPQGRELLGQVRQARVQVVAPLIASLAPREQEHVRAAVNILGRLLDTGGAPELRPGSSPVPTTDFEAASASPESG